MASSTDARQLAVLLRIADTLDIVGDITVTVADPSQLLAWATVLGDPSVMAWRAEDSGQRYINLSTYNRHAPVHGQITVVLCAADHRPFWDELLPDDLGPGTEQPLHHAKLTDAWNTMPLVPPDAE